ncbi:MAG: hypothetical protein AB7K24_03830 [Gemmataceae bacterium]
MGLTALWIVAGGLLAWLFLPDLWTFLRGVPVDNSIEDGPASFERYWDEHAAFAPKYRELAALGFERVCIYHERLGGVREHQFCFASPREQCFASVYRLSLNDDAESPPRLSLHTAFTSGAAIVTRSAGDMEQVRRDDLWEGAAMPFSEVEPVQQELSPAQSWHGLLILLHVVGIALAGGGVVTWLAHYHVLALVMFASGLLAVGQGRRVENEEEAKIRHGWHAPLDIVLMEHRRRVEVFMSSGHVPVGDYSAAGLLDAERAYYRIPYVRRLALILHAVFFGLKAAFFGVGLLAAGLTLGFGHWSVPAALIGMSLFWLGLRAYLRMRHSPAALAVE